MGIEIGEIVHVRSRQYLVEEVINESGPQEDTILRLSCLEDDAQGEPLEIFWEREVGSKLIEKSSWESVTGKGFDEPKNFSAYLHTLKWGCVTSTDSSLFQAPYRAGIEVKAYQLLPLQKAISQPRVSLFIADDVGLGKTIEAGLILREMLMRQKVKRVVISCPPSVVKQWQEEMEYRFGLIFEIFDRDYVAKRRRERGYSINPWTTHSRFIISHSLLRDESYSASLRRWLGSFSPSSLLILDEAHNAAPATSARYAIDSKLTKTIQDLALRFEHKLFLSATPHNGHSNSFTTLLEMLDPQRFCRGIAPDSKLLDEVMVRRLKQDLREIGDTDFPERRIIPLVIDGLPEDHPELKLALLLQEYRTSRETRLKTQSKSTYAAAMLVLTSLQKRLLSSIEAFHRTLQVHRKSLERSAIKIKQDLSLLRESIGSDDDRAELNEKDVLKEEDLQMEAATMASFEAITPRELELLEQMSEIAEQARDQYDSRVQRLIDWIKEELCPDLGSRGALWNERRVVIFTEYTDSKRYLEDMLTKAIGASDRALERIETFTGGMSIERREAIKSAFNSDPKEHPLRILIATDAAREGVNLQNHCSDLFHFDVPWNPARMEQRNGRIDRKLQRQAVVRCYYFYLTQRSEDRVIDVLVKKTNTILQELGSLSPVIQKNVTELLDQGIRANQEESLIASLQDSDRPNRAIDFRSFAIKEELEIIRTRQENLLKQQSKLEDMLSKSKKWLGLNHHIFRDALSASLQIIGADPLIALDAQQAVLDIDRALWTLEDLGKKEAGDPKWTGILDSLREPRLKGESLYDWRERTAIRPIVFSDPGSLDGKVVHIHLEHRLVQRLLGRFRAQGFIHHELNRACVCLTEDPIPKIIVLGRLSLYGAGATRLHDEIVAVAAQWLPPEARGRGKLRPLSETEKKDVISELEESLVIPRLLEIPPMLFESAKEYAPQDVEDLIPHLERKAEDLAETARKKLAKRGDEEAQAMAEILAKQKKRIAKRENEIQAEPLNLFNPEEIKQRENDRRHWRKRLEEIEGEMISEPERIKDIFEVKATRVEPVGLIYLWPVSN